MALTDMTVIEQIQASDITVQIREYLWPTPNEGDVQIEAEPTLALMVSPRPAAAEARHRINPFSNSFSSLGPLIFHPTGTPIHARGSGGRLKVVTCSFSRDRFERVSGITDSDWDSNRLRACFNVRGTPIDGTLMRLAQETAVPGFASGILVESLGLAIVVELSRFFDRAPHSSEPTVGQLAGWQLRRLNDYLNAITGHSPTVAELAELCGVSSDHLSRAFRRTTGQSIAKHVEEIRMQKAKNLLTETNFPLKEISFRLGFPSQSGFSIAFRRCAGQTPARFRQQFSLKLCDAPADDSKCLSV
jgi:AraC family transcriptional regulator